MPVGFCLLATLMVKLSITFARDYTDNWVQRIACSGVEVSINVVVLNQCFNHQLGFSFYHIAVFIRRQSRLSTKKIVGSIICRFELKTIDIFCTNTLRIYIIGGSYTWYVYMFYVFIHIIILNFSMQVRTQYRKKTFFFSYSMIDQFAYSIIVFPAVKVNLQVVTCIKSTYSIAAYIYNI